MLIAGIVIFLLLMSFLFWSVKESHEIIGEANGEESIDLSVAVVKPGVEENIEYWANIFGVDTGLAKQIAWCESRYQNVCNSNGCQYGQGIYQFVPGTWRNYTEDLKNADVFDENLNVLVAMMMLSNKEYYHWQPSSDCWAK